MPGSITEISQRSDRDRNSVKRDVEELERVGLVSIVEKVCSGHERVEETRINARLEAALGDLKLGDSYA